MSLPTQRLTITPTEYSLLKSGLDVLANGLASANDGHFPHRHPWHLIDRVASDVYRGRAYDDEMAARIISVRGKLWDLIQSRKVRINAFELTVLALALRLSKARNLVDAAQSISMEIRLLQFKIELYRKRAKRAAISKIGRVAYQSAAQRWRRFVAWLRYNTLYLRIPKRGEAWRATLWREQRLQITELINKVLTERFFEVPSEAAMAKVVTLITCSLRRCRHSVGLRELLRCPQEYTDFLFGFVEKRVELKRLPGAPVPEWQAISDRADKFRELQSKSCGKDSTPFDVGSDKIIATEPERLVSAPPKIKTPRPFTRNRQPLTAETLIDAMGIWLYQEVTTKFNLTREVCEQAQHQITRHLLDQYRTKTAATSFNGVVQELRPADSFADIPTIINIYVRWMLEILLALRQEPAWIYQAIRAIGRRAMQLAEKARYDEWTATLANRSQLDSLGA